MKMKTCILPLALLAFSHLPLSAQSDLPKGNPLHAAEVYFAFGKHDLQPAADSTLQAVAQIFLAKPKAQIHITAHTDSIGSLANNLALSQRRSRAVEQQLQALGVPGPAIFSNVFGEAKPATNNWDEPGRQRNRRVTVEVTEPIAMNTLEGQIRDSKTGQFILAEVVVRGKSFKDSLQTDSAGRFNMLVPVGEVIGVDVIAKGFFLESKMMKVPPSKIPLMEILLRPAAVGEMADIENLFFVGNQDTLLPPSLPTLPRVLRFMQVNPSLKIEIAGHVNHPNSPPIPVGHWEHRLSERRAIRVYNYLIDNGIAPERLSWKGYSNWEMRFPLARSEEQQAANRRVEIRVVGDGN